MHSNTDISIKWMGLESSFEYLQKEIYDSAYVILDTSILKNARVLSLLERYDLAVNYVIGSEPTTDQVNEICDNIRLTNSFTSVIGVGGGSAMDLAKAIGVTSVNGGKAELLQGWDLPITKSLPTLVIPTIPGTGAEVSRTAVLTGPERKLGINSDFTMPDNCIVDPSLFATIPKKYGVPTLLDCYIHSVEIVRGRFSDNYAVWAAEDILERFDDIMKAPYDPTNRYNAELYAYCSHIGGLGLLGGVVGACHGLSYGLSHALNISHSYANIIAMEALGDYYECESEKVKTYCEKNRLDYWAKVTDDNSAHPDIFDQVQAGALFMEKLWLNAVSKDKDAIPKAKQAIKLMNNLLEGKL